MFNLRAFALSETQRTHTLTQSIPLDMSTFLSFANDRSVSWDRSRFTRSTRTRSTTNPRSSTLEVEEEIELQALRVPVPPTRAAEP